MAADFVVHSVIYCM